MSFVHLHVHTEYSLLDGMTRIGSLIEKAKSMNMPAVTMTDHGSLYGAFKFYVKAKDAGIKPIIGVEAYKAKNTRFEMDTDEDRKNYHLVLLAKSLTGYKNLLKIVSSSFLEGFYYKPRVDFDLLAQYSEDIVALSGCLNGEIPSLLLANQPQKAEKALQQYLDIFGSDFYLEIQRHPGMDRLDMVNQDLIQLSKKFGVPLVATNDVHYLDKEDAYAQEILLCIQTGRAIFEKDRPLSMIDVPDYYFKSPEEMKGQFLDIPEAIENTVKIAEQCNLDLPHGKLILPHFDTPDNKPDDVYLKELVYKNIERVKHNDPQIVEKRIAYELDVIAKKGYSAYFLIVQDFVNWAKNTGIAVGPGRGSVAGSLVAFLTKITEINPLDYNLPFERFLSYERPSPPDADIDFADVRRDEVLQYVVNKYGEDKVAHIITFGTMEARLAVRDVARAFGMSYAQGDRIAKMIPQGKQGFSMSLEQAIQESPQLKVAYDNEPDVKKVMDVAKKVEGLPRHASVHAAGVVISDKPLTEYVPLQREAKEGKIITQYDMYSIDLNAVSDNKGVGLLKVDFLGLRNLTILEEAIKFVQQTKGIKLNMQEVSLQDKKTYELISRGTTIGVFQLESAGMRRLAKDLQPTKISDIYAMVALYRPGPMDLIPMFLEGKKNPRKISYLHPDLKPILEETYGILVYQEQVMQIAHRLAGYTMSEADQLRMAMGKKKKSLMEKEEKKFMAGCLKHGYTKKLTENIFKFIEKFASYGFNKAHSAAYALIAYWTAYMKANYPVEFMTALLSAELQGSAGPIREQKMAQAIEECRKMNIAVLPPDVNKSQYTFSIEDGAIRFGLSAIKNVGSAAIDSILEARSKEQFIGLKDFLMRVDLRKVNKKTVESMIHAGAFDEFGTRATFLHYYPLIVRDISDSKEEQEKGQFGLFTTDSSDKKLQDNFPALPELAPDKLSLMEKDVFGFFLNKNPLVLYKDLLSKKITKKIGEINHDDTKKMHILAGIISTKKVIKTKKDNSEMAFLNVFDDSGSIEVTVFPKTYAQMKDMFVPNAIVLFKGKVDDRDGTMSVVVDKAVRLDNRKIEGVN